MPFVTMLRHTALQASLNSGVPQQEKKERVWAQLLKHTTKEPNIALFLQCTFSNIRIYMSKCALHHKLPFLLM